MTKKRYFAKTNCPVQTAIAIFVRCKFRMFKCLQLPYLDLLIEIAQIYPCSPFLKAHFPPVTRDAASWVCQQFKNGNAPPIDTLCFVLNILTESLKNLAFFNSFKLTMNSASFANIWNIWNIFFHDFPCHAFQPPPPTPAPNAPAPSAPSIKAGTSATPLHGMEPPGCVLQAPVLITVVLEGREHLGTVAAEHMGKWGDLTSWKVAISQAKLGILARNWDILQRTVWFQQPKLGIATSSQWKVHPKSKLRAFHELSNSSVLLSAKA